MTNQALPKDVEKAIKEMFKSLQPTIKEWTSGGSGTDAVCDCLVELKCFRNRILAQYTIDIPSLNEHDWKDEEE